MSDKVTICCARVSDAVVFVPGSIERKCGHCSEKVWLAPSTQNQIRNNGWTDLLFVCNRCTEAQFRKLRGGVIEIVPPTDEAISEIHNMRNSEN